MNKLVKAMRTPGGRLTGDFFVGVADKRHHMAGTIVRKDQVMPALRAMIRKVSRS